MFLFTKSKSMFQRFTIFLLLMLFNQVSFSQVLDLEPKYPNLFKVIPELKVDDPEWVKALYSAEPNFYLIEASFQRYFREHPFEKSVHTQNFKYFSRMVRNEGYLQDDGTILAPSNENALGPVLLSQSPQSETWTALGPLVTYLQGGQEQKSSQTNIFTFDQCMRFEFPVRRSENHIRNFPKVKFHRCKKKSFSQHFFKI